MSGRNFRSFYETVARKSLLCFCTSVPPRESYSLDANTNLVGLCKSRKGEIRKGDDVKKPRMFNMTVRGSARF